MILKNCIKVLALFRDYIKMEGIVVHFIYTEMNKSKFYHSPHTIKFLSASYIKMEGIKVHFINRDKAGQMFSYM